MTVSTAVHDATVWAKARLDGIDAAVAAMEKRLATATGEARVQAHLALMDAQKERQEFQVRSAGLRREVQVGSAKIRAELEQISARFEQALGRWADSMGRYGVDAFGVPLAAMNYEPNKESKDAQAGSCCKH